MKFTMICMALIVVIATVQVQAANYAVVVAGSSGYYNYRHQSDVCHAFQTLTSPTKGNIPRENVITFMYDDIANSDQNPVKGNLINHPNGTNVYANIKKDYTGADVTPQNFLKVLAGNQTSTGGPTLHTTAQDNVFVYFADHGAPGLIAFPSSYLYAKDLMDTLKYMHTQRKYAKLVFYIEACESGSMFANGLLPDNMNIFATTAATPDQSSYACYYSQSRQTYLGDEYSVRWMEDADVNDHKGSTWTLEEQFKKVVSETKQSQPQQYGETSISKDTVEQFQGNYESSSSAAAAGASRRRRVATPAFTPCGDAVSSRDVKLKTLMSNKKYATTVDMKAKWQGEINAELVHRAKSDYVVSTIVERLVGARNKDAVLATRAVQPRDFDCYGDAIESVESVCGRFDDYSLKWVKVFATLCDNGVAAREITSIAASVCADL